MIDGDTLVVEVLNVDTTVRLLNVDAPETKNPNKAVQCLGPEASAFLTELLPAGTAVQLEYDGERLDRYGRTLAGVWLQSTLVNAEVAREGLGVPVQFNGQVRFLPPVEAAAEEAELLEKGAYAADVSCALPAQVDRALEAMDKVNDPNKETSAAYAAAIKSLSAARKAAREAESLAKTGRRATGVTAWVFHDATRIVQQARLDSGIARADDRLDDLRSTQKSLEKKDTAEKKRKLAAAKAKARREAAAREAEAERQRAEQDPYDDEQGGSSGSNPDGYTGRRCYAPGGKTYRPC